MENIAYGLICLIFHLPYENVVFIIFVEIYSKLFFLVTMLLVSTQLKHGLGKLHNNFLSYLQAHMNIESIKILIKVSSIL